MTLYRYVSALFMFFRLAAVTFALSPKAKEHGTNLCAFHMISATFCQQLSQCLPTNTSGHLRPQHGMAGLPAGNARHTRLGRRTGRTPADSLISSVSSPPPPPRLVLLLPVSSFVNQIPRDRITFWNQNARKRGRMRKSRDVPSPRFPLVPLVPPSPWVPYVLRTCGGCPSGTTVTRRCQLARGLLPSKVALVPATLGTIRILDLILPPVPNSLG